MPLSVRLSVVIITYNEEKNIERCLASVRGVADEIIVVDSFSTDRTKGIGLRHGVTFIEHPFAGHIEQKNFALAQATHNYVLSLDADEALSEPLRQSILAAKQHWPSDAYAMNRLTNYCGHWIRHGDWYPDRKIRLFDRRKATWGGANPHDKIMLTNGATTRRLRGDLLHYSFYSVSQHLQKLSRYAEISAKAAVERGKRAPIIRILVSPWFTFTRSYLLRGGFLDGYYGFLVAVISAFENFIKYVQIRELHRRNHSSGNGHLD